MAPPLATGDLQSGKILLIVALAVLPIGAIAFARAGRALKELGKGQFAIEQELPSPLEPGAPPPPQGPAMREAEVRQMLEAKSFRRVQRGLDPLDIEAEMRAMLAPAPGGGMDARLREEVRQLVMARNERRMRRGQEPLDVEAETRRQLTDLEALGQ